MNDTPLLDERPRWSWPMAGLIVLLAFASYLFVLFQAQWVWDDPDYIWRNPNLVEENGLQRIWESNEATPQYYPVVHTTFWLEYQLVDPEVHYEDSLPAQLFHFNNVLIFALTALVFWQVLLRLQVPGALVAVLLFAVHPTNVESVAWVTERKNMLSGLFALLAVLSFLRFARVGDREGEGVPKGLRWVVLVASLATVALYLAVTGVEVSGKQYLVWYGVAALAAFFVPRFGEGSTRGGLHEFAARKKFYFVAVPALVALSFVPPAVYERHYPDKDWVNELRLVLLGMAGLFSALGLVDAKLNRERELEPIPVRWFSAFQVALFWILGVLSKSVIAFVPPALVLILIWRKPRQLFDVRIVLLISFMLLTGAAAGLHTAWLERTQVGAEDVFFPEFDGSLDRLMLSGTVVWTYFKHLVLPIEQMFFYPKWDPEASSILQWLALITAIALPLVLLWKSKRLGLGPLIAILIFGGALFPVMGFTNVYPMRFSWVADHFQYHANFAMFALAGAVLIRIPLGAAARKGALGLALLGGVLLSNQHGFAFENAERLWRTTIAQNPECWLAHQNLGVEVNKRAMAARAEGDERTARQLEQEAQQHMYDALEYERDPHLLQSIANNHLGWYSMYKNPADLQKAEVLVKEALERWERYGLLHKLMGDIHLARGNAKEAFSSYDFALNDIRTSPFQRQFLQKKMTGQVGAAIATNWSVAVLNYGKELLNDGKAAEALALWSRPLEAYGDPGTMPLHQLYAWGPPNHWLDIELHRIWMLAAAADSSLRNPQKALADFEVLARVSAPRVAGSGMPQSLQQRYMIEIADLRAAIMASLGRFQEARETSSETIRQATQLGAPPSYLEALRQRNEIYRQKQAYRFRYRVPVFGG